MNNWLTQTDVINHYTGLDVRMHNISLYNVQYYALRHILCSVLYRFRYVAKRQLTWECLNRYTLRVCFVVGQKKKILLVHIFINLYRKVSTLHRYMIDSEKYSNSPESQRCDEFTVNAVNAVQCNLIIHIRFLSIAFKQMYLSAVRTCTSGIV